MHIFGPDGQATTDCDTSNSIAVGSESIALAVEASFSFRSLPSAAKRTDI